MNKNLVIGMIGIMCVMTILSAIEVEKGYTFKQNTEINLKRTCYFNGTYCDISTRCNITITDRDNNNILINSIMGNTTINYPNWNKSLSKNNNLLIGVYKDDMTCCNINGCGSETFYHEITPSGEKNVLGLMIILFILGYGITLAGAWSRNIPTTIIGGMGMMILGLYTLNNGIDVYRNFATQFFSIVTSAMGGYWTFVAGMELIEGG